ncbi:MAG: response regulator transcription factor [Phycisphaeraceae bacterium]|nr:response regulator transcription factor [Phycisphaeraceae bacterium]
MVQPGSAVSQVWGILIHEPLTAVAVMDRDGRRLWVNDQCVQIIKGPQGRASDFMGRSLEETFPGAFAQILRGVIDEVFSSGEAVLLRSVWRGVQYLTWIYEVQPGEEPGGMVDARVLLMTRPANSDDLKRYEAHPGVKVKFAAVVELGSLNVLTHRELEILALIGQGLSLPDIASMLGRSPKTIEKHREAIGRKLGMNDRLALAEVARRAGLTVADAERQRL